MRRNTEPRGEERGLDLIDSLRPAQVLELARPKLPQDHAFGQFIREQLRRHPGQQHLAAAGDRQQPRGPVHRRPEVVPVALLANPGVQAHPHHNRPAGRP
jgi:hypothetical protein